MGQWPGKKNGGIAGAVASLPERKSVRVPRFGRMFPYDLLRSEFRPEIGHEAGPSFRRGELQTRNGAFRKIKTQRFLPAERMWNP